MAALLEIDILRRHAVSPALAADVDRAFETASHAAASAASPGCACFSRPCRASCARPFDQPRRIASLSRSHGCLEACHDDVPAPKSRSRRMASSSSPSRRPDTKLS